MTSTRRTTPTWAECRRAARAARGAELGRAAVDRFRPRGVSGLVRSRPPLAVLLHLAARRGLLVWRSPEEFLVLDPPLRGERRPGDRGAAGFLDRNWDVLVFGTPPLVLLLLALLSGLTGTRAGVTAALLLIVLLLGWVLVLLLAGVAYGARVLYRIVERPPDRHVGPALDSALYAYWSLALVHRPAGNRAGLPELLDEARGRVDPAAGAGGMLVYVDAVFSTAAARDAVNEAVAARRWRPDGGPVLVRLDEARREPRPGSDAAGSGNAITLILGAIAVWVVVCAQFVASAERSACATRSCPDAPTGYLDALLWLAGRVLPFAAPDELAAVADGSRLLGRGATALGYVAIACLVVAVSRAAAAQRAYLRSVHEEVQKITERRPTVGLVTALPVEFHVLRALLDDAVDVTVGGDRGRYVVGALPSSDPYRPHQVALVQPALTGQLPAATVGTNLSRSFPSVNVTVMVGIAAGVPRPDRPDRHVRLGDVVVSTWGVVDYDHVTVTPDGELPRRAFPAPSPLLAAAVNRLVADEIGGARPWERWLDVAGRPDLAAYARPPEDTDVLRVEGSPDPVPHPDRTDSGHRPGFPVVREGRIGSGGAALGDATVRDRYARRHDLTALEMEGAGIGESAFLAGLEWMVVRGISDYGDSRRDGRWKPYAALVAAAYTREMLAQVPPLADRGGQPIGPG